MGRTVESLVILHFLAIHLIQINGGYSFKCNSIGADKDESSRNCSNFVRNILCLSLEHRWFPLA